MARDADRTTATQSGDDPLAVLRARIAAANDPGLSAALAELERSVETQALERASLQSRLSAAGANVERELAKAHTLVRVAETVNSSLELEVVLRRVLDTAVEVMNAERGFVMIANAVSRSGSWRLKSPAATRESR